MLLKFNIASLRCSRCWENRVKSENSFRWAFELGAWRACVCQRKEKNLSLAFHERVMHNKRKMEGRMVVERGWKIRKRKPGVFHMCVSANEMAVGW